MRMMWLCMMGGLCVGAGCQKSYNPFRIEKSEIFHRVHTVGIMPALIQVESDLEDPNKVKNLFTDCVDKKLRDKGFKTIPVAEYRDIYDSLKKAMGPMYDPYTGKVKEEKLETLREHTRREYLAKFPVDAILYSCVFVSKVKWYSNRAEWHGVSEAATGREGFWADFTAPGASGTMAGLSLSIIMENPQEENYYVNFGGIQLLSHVKNMDFVDIPKSQLLTDANKIRRSVDIALRPLLSDEKQNSMETDDGFE